MTATPNPEKNSAAFDGLLNQADELRADPALLDQAEPTPSFLYRVSATIERETGKRPDPDSLAKIVWLAFDATDEQLADAELPGGEARADFSGEFADAVRTLTPGFTNKNSSANTKRGKAGRAGSGNRPFPLLLSSQHCRNNAAVPVSLFSRSPDQCHLRRLVLAAGQTITTTTQAVQTQRNQTHAHQSPTQKSEAKR